MTTSNKKSKSRGVPQMIDDFIYEKYNIRLSDYNKLARVAFAIVVFVPIIVVFVTMVGNKNHQANIGSSWNFFSQQGNKSQSLNTKQGDNSEAINVQTGDNSLVYIFGKDDQNKIIFTPDKWNDGEGNLAALRKDPSTLILPLNFTSGLLRYDEPINTDVDYEIIFKPLGDKAINFVINIPEIYEIIIGDGDYETITLKYSLGLSQPVNVLVSEKNTGQERPKINYRVNKDSEIKINMVQKKMPNGNLWIKFDIHYWGEGKEQGKIPQSFSYEFVPSPLIEDSLFLNLGLIRGDYQDTHISIKLIKPLID